VGESFTFHGRVFSGSGRGSYYVGHPEYRKRFQRSLGYVPYPGTLNLRLDSLNEIGVRRRLRLEEDGIRIEEFIYRGEKFSSVKCFEGELERKKVALLIVSITHYDDSVLELVSPLYLREALGLRDGSEVPTTIGF